MPRSYWFAEKTLFGSGVKHLEALTILALALKLPCDIHRMAIKLSEERVDCVGM